MKSIKLRANAKINLALTVKNKRNDGYHELESIIQEIDFHDDVILSESSEIKFSTNHPALAREADNICVRAAQLLRDEFRIPGLQIFLDKKLPIGAGIGGGSSDAAAVLCGSRDLYGLNIASEQLGSLAVQLGADVPFFLTGKAAYVKGIGDILESIEIYHDYHILLVLPEVQISTRWAYKNLNLALTSKFGDYKFRGFRFQNLKLSDFRSAFFNDFEKLVFNAHPSLADIKTDLYDAGADYAAMSGSGAVLFGLFEKADVCSLAFKSLSRTYRCKIAKPII
jgi:4-diphosphocytidyl-2-C-methyl-D-erythritol kinase